MISVLFHWLMIRDFGEEPSPKIPPNGEVYSRMLYNCRIPAYAIQNQGKSLSQRADGRRDGFRKVWMVFQMPVRYADIGGDTGGASDREGKKLFYPGYHRKAVVDGSHAWGSVPAEGQDDFYWKEPAWGEGDTDCGTRTGT